MSHVSGKRLLHVIGSTVSALELAGRWDVEQERACMAGLLHDVGRNIPPDAIKAYLEARGEDIPGVDRDFPNIWHGLYAAAVLRHELGIDDPEMRDALVWHSTAAPVMTTLQKIVFISDSIEPTRVFPGAGEIRRLADIDLDKALAWTLESKYNHLKINNTAIHSRLVQARIYYCGDNVSE